MLPHNVIPATSKKFICNDCNKIFNTKSHLTQHKKKKIPCFDSHLYSINLDKFNEQPEYVNTNDENSLCKIVKNKLLNDFMESYQTLLDQSTINNNIILEYQKVNKQLTEDILKYKLKIKSILQIINSNIQNENDEENLIVLPIKNVRKIIPSL